MNYRILMVEDDLIDQMAFKNFVKKEGLNYEYTMVNSMVEAKALKNVDEFDLIIMDFNLGDGTAFDLLTSFRNIPSIILTGAGDEEIAVTALKNGAYDYIVKDQERRYLKILPITVDNVLKKYENEKQLKQNKEHLSLFVRHTPAAIAMLDKDMKYIMYSKRWQEDYELGDQNLVGKSHYDVFKNLSEERKDIHRQCLAGSTKKCEEDKIVRANGNIQYLRWEILPWHLDNNEVGGLMMFTEDITQQVLSKERIETQTEELARSNADLEQFAYVASHDLQEPLRMIGNFVQLLEVRYKEVVDEKGKDYIRYAVEGVSRMQTLIKDLLEYSRVGRIEENFSNISTHEVLNEVVQDLQLPISERGVKINIGQMPQKLYCIESQIRLVFRNLISNGIKFNNNVHPEISIFGDEDDEYFYLSVKDNGIGIQERHKDQIFDIFQRLHKQTDYPGTGIGLAICKKVIERHGGIIYLGEESGAGSVFNFSLHKDAKLKSA